MRKPRELRQYLTGINDHLKANPDRLHVFVDKATVVCKGTDNLSHEYRYELNLIVTDYADSEDTLIVPILAWLRTNQPELFENPERRKDGIRLEVDVLTNTTCDISITISLTERVIVALGDDGKLHAQHVAEPPHPDLPDWNPPL